MNTCLFQSLNIINSTQLKPNVMNYLFDDLITVRKHMKNLFNSFIEFLRHSKKTVLLIIVVAATTLILSTTISIWLSRFDNYLIPSLGTIRTTGVETYGGNITLTAKEEQQIDWGTIYPGTSTNRSFYIKSRSSIETTLNYTTGNWTFLDSEGKNVTESLASYISRPLAMDTTWDYNGTPISPKEEIYVTLTLRAFGDIRFINYLIDEEVEEFSFDIHIYAEE